jgi:hypothetical protein
MSLEPTTFKHGQKSVYFSRQTMDKIEALKLRTESFSEFLERAIMALYQQETNGINAGTDSHAA